MIAESPAILESRHQPSREELLSWAATTNGFIEAFGFYDEKPIILEDFQREINDDHSWGVLVVKSRQIGYSFARSLAKWAKAHLRRNYTGIFVSYNLKEAKEKIRYARHVHEAAPRSIQRELIIDNLLELEFDNGSRLLSVFDPRGWGNGDVDMDEVARIPRARDIYNSSLYVTSHGGQLHVGSTYLGKSGLFWDIVSQRDGKYANFSRHDVPWWFSRFLCTDVEKAKGLAPAMLTADRVEAFGTAILREIFASALLEDFQQECELTPLDEATAYIPLEMILACCNPELVLYDTFEALHDNCRGPLYAGFDVGRRRNASELWVNEKLGDKFYQRMLKTWAGEPFESQRYQLERFIEVTKPVRLCIDETGMGMNLAENLRNKFGDIVEPVNFAGRIDSDIDLDRRHTVAVKERMASNTKILFESHAISIYPDRQTIDQIHSIKREVTSSGNVRYDTERNEKHHADRFWALALAVLAASQKQIRIAGQIGAVGAAKIIGREIDGY